MLLLFPPDDDDDDDDDDAGSVGGGLLPSTAIGTLPLPALPLDDDDDADVAAGAAVGLGFMITPCAAKSDVNEMSAIFDTTPLPPPLFVATEATGREVVVEPPLDEEDDEDKGTTGRT